MDKLFPRTSLWPFPKFILLLLYFIFFISNLIAPLKIRKTHKQHLIYSNSQNYMDNIKQFT